MCSTDPSLQYSRPAVGRYNTAVYLQESVLQLGHRLHVFDPQSIQLL